METVESQKERRNLIHNGYRLRKAEWQAGETSKYLCWAFQENFVTNTKLLLRMLLLTRLCLDAQLLCAYLADVVISLCDSVVAHSYLARFWRRAFYLRAFDAVPSFTPPWERSVPRPDLPELTLLLIKLHIPFKCRTINWRQSASSAAIQRLSKTCTQLLRRLFLIIRSLLLSKTIDNLITYDGSIKCTVAEHNQVFSS